MQAHHNLFLADLHVQELIRRKAKDMVGLFGFSKADRADLEQEFRLEILKQSAQYDQSKSSIQTFSDRVIAHRISDLIKERQAQCRDWRRTVSLSDPLPGAEDELTLEDCLDTDGSIDVRKSPCSPRQEVSDKRRDIQRFLSRLDTLRAARYNDALTVRAGDKWVTYKSDKEMATALDALEREIAAKSGKRGKKRVLTYAEKGL